MNIYRYRDGIAHPLYKVWNNMVQRCTNPNAPNYRWYGARGITIAPEWRDYDRFAHDLADTWSEGLSLDRRDVNGPYSPANTHWIAKRLQSRNRRNNVWVEALGGGRAILTDVARALGVLPHVLKRRLARGAGPALPDGTPIYRLV